MEEKILEKLDCMGKQIEQMDKKIDNLDKKMVENMEELREELTVDFEKKMDQKNVKLKEELTIDLEKRLEKKMDQKNAKLKEELMADLERKILDRMFVFEEEYGKMITIAFEELTCRNSTQETNSQQIANLEKREQLNTAYVQNHEDRIQKLEKIRV